MKRSHWPYREPLISGSSSLEKKDNKKELVLEFILKFAGIVLTFTTILIAIFQYKQAVEREFRASFYNEQIKVYNELLHLSSCIAIFNVDSLDTPSFHFLEADFNKLYYGRLNLYQNEEVANKIAHFYVALKRFKINEAGIDNQMMENLVFQISQACRESLAGTYDINLNNLKFDHDQLNKSSHESTVE